VAHELRVGEAPRIALLFVFVAILFVFVGMLFVFVGMLFVFVAIFFQSSNVIT
jgi:hypothetical protein